MRKRAHESPVVRRSPTSTLDPGQTVSSANRAIVTSCSLRLIHHQEESHGSGVWTLQDLVHRASKGAARRKTPGKPVDTGHMLKATSEEAHTSTNSMGHSDRLTANPADRQKPRAT